ncbi:hypothetical protein P154DRAFT_526425 [Amniculicola lignicola CBS 123094]|uniref:Mediator of RNA polymerase II transcription subunit 13 n=1 Tax=Amniculicola lignicola CBS 123094 TaxID=1392246 RepID=A0A6A5W2V4_9PLEO|nr:hypothetical protein P154DRAFT_526425 [Amniculicola lignicola CBS 123094]
MEFLKTCNTNAQAIGDFDAVAYQAFSVKRNLARAPATDGERNPAESIRAAEAELRQAQHLVVKDASRPWLWRFTPTTPEKAGQKPPDLPSIDGYDFNAEQYGVMKASELARPPLRYSNLNTPSSASSNSPATPGAFKLAGGQRVPQGSALPASDLQQPHDTNVIYELFTSSVVALISYYLVRDYRAIALNYRTFISKSLVPDNKNDGANSLDSPYWLTNISVYWTSSGTLVLSALSIEKLQIHSLQEVNTDDAQKRLQGACVRIAPNGMLAKISSFDQPADAVSEDTVQRTQRKRLKTTPLDQGLNKWKAAVTRWLAKKGYTIPTLSEKSAWVKIRIASTNQATPPSPAFSSYSREVLWPRALCFHYEDPINDGDISGSQANAPVSSEKGLKWFETPTSAGFRDPMDVAQHWFLGKLERDRLVEARRKKQKADEDAARIKAETPGLYPSSPLNSRTGVYGDMQAVSGVYPTPPDGILPGTTQSVGDASAAGAPPSTVLVPGGQNPAINLLAPQETVMLNQQQHPATSPEYPAHFEHFNSSSGNDDLFEDMEDDVFDGNGVTDADFNFFDEPDAEDVTMTDAPALEQTKTVEVKNVENFTTSTPQEVRVKEEMSDPLAALEDALASASSEHTEDVAKNPNIKQEKMEQKLASRRKPEKPKVEQPISKVTVMLPATKEPTPPLSPHLIEERLLPSPRRRSSAKTSRDTVSERHRDSVFDPVSFNRKISLSDAKYQEGRFSVSHEKVTRAEAENKTPLKRAMSLLDLPLLTKLRYAVGVTATGRVVDDEAVDVDSDLSDSHSESLSSEEDEDMGSAGAELFAVGLILPGKRKLPTEGNATPVSTTSYAESFGGDGLEFLGLQTDEGCLTWFEPSLSDWSLARAPPPQEISTINARNPVPSFSPIVSSLPNTPTSQPDTAADPSDEKPLNAKDNIAVAQIVTDQIVKATLDILHEIGPSGRKFPHRSPPDTYLQNVVNHLFPKALECNVLGLISVQDVFPEMPPQVKGQQRPAPRRMDGTNAISFHINQINPPHVRVRRGDNLWDLLPPALPFWETLGLSPCSPAKNIVSFCVYPHSASIRPYLESFMLNMQIAYEGCKLGNHTRVETVPEFEGGLVACKIGASASTKGALKALRETCVHLGKLLAMKLAQMREKDEAPKINAFVIYMVDPFEAPSAVWELCSAFWLLFQSYSQAPTGRQDFGPRPDLVLQIVPIKYIASFEAPVVLDSSVYVNLAREVYDRCPPSAPSEDKTPLGIYVAPSFQLEEAVPRGIPFKLNAEPPQDLLRENSYIHLGYAISLDGAWLTAAWTDSCGKSQAVVSYHLGTRAFSEIAKEIWQTTIEILSTRRVTWRVCIAKSGVMEREESDMWMILASCPTQLNLFITLLTVDINPPFKFTPTMSTNPIANPSTGGGPNTPISTPQAGVSPPQSSDLLGLTPAATPSADAPDLTADPEARLVDLTDESWGVILAHRLHNSNSTVECRPCLISGLLVKRGESSTTKTTTPNNEIDTDPGPIIVAVNILWVGAVGGTRNATPSTPAPSPNPSPFSSTTDPALLPQTPGGSNIIPQSPGPSPLLERSSTSLMWTPTPQSRATAESLLKEVLAQYRGLGLLARLKGMRGTRGGCVPWHVVAAERGVAGLGKCLGGS